MKIIVNHPFVSRKTAINWPAAGMKKGSDSEWLGKLSDAVQLYKVQLIEIFKSGKRLQMKVKIHGKSNRINPLDIHDALAQVADQLTDILFPRPKGKTKPQTQDRHFWREEIEKVENLEERVEIEIGELKQE